MQTGVPSAFSVQEKRCGGEKRGGIEGEKAEKSWAEQGRGGRKKKFEKNKNSTCQIKKYVLLFISCQREILLLRYAAVAQLDRVFGYEPKGRGFESLQPYQNRKIRICLPWATDSGFSFPCMKRHRSGAESAAAVSPRCRRRFSVHTARISSGREKDDFHHFSSRRKKDEIYHCFRPCNDFYHPCHAA